MRNPQFAKVENLGRNTSLLYSLLAIFLATTFSVPAWAAKKIIIDTDPGTDDALALMLALNSPELDVRAVTVVPGNVTAAMGLDNALRMVSLANRCDIPVAAGAQHPLFQKLITAEFWHGIMLSCHWLKHQKMHLFILSYRNHLTVCQDALES